MEPALTGCYGAWGHGCRSESKTDNVIAAKQAGVSNYIVKPFNAQTLKSKIDAVFPG